ncbi:MAG: FtsX-like permease family protein [Flammeovirgaceae bacterium]|nr:FtsX-like permease family protein [Flammeovirgaceae bacterium]
MSELHLNSEFEEGRLVTSKRMMTVWYFSAIGIFVLVLACINFMNLSTARSEKRAKEVGIRKSIGSLRSQLVQQFFGETLLIATIASATALIVVQISLPWFNAVSDKDMALPITLPLFWISIIGFTLLTGLLAGSYPAIYLSSFNPVKTLKGTFKTGRFEALPRRSTSCNSVHGFHYAYYRDNYSLSADSIRKKSTDWLFQRRLDWHSRFPARVQRCVSNAEK